MCGCNRRAAARASRITVQWANEVDPRTGEKPLVRNYVTPVEARAAMALKPGGVKVTGG